MIMSIQHRVRESSREKLQELRRSARKFQPVTKGTPEERGRAAVKGYNAWADLREEVNKQETP